jgi:hypothetical protein
MRSMEIVKASTSALASSISGAVWGIRPRGADLAPVLPLLHDQAVACGQNPDPMQLMQTARGGRLQQLTDQARMAITGKPKKE